MPEGETEARERDQTGTGSGQGGADAQAGGDGGHATARETGRGRRNGRCGGGAGMSWHSQTAGLLGAMPRLFSIFLDLCKAYDTIDKGCCLAILEDCGVSLQLDC